MDILLLAIVIVVMVVILALAKGKSRASAYPYQRSKYLLSNAERSFYGVLVQAVGSSGVVFSKVRVADVIEPQKVLGRADWLRAFNAISSKHFDFIVCGPDDLSIKLAVELDDESHRSSKAQKRDALLNGASQSAGLPLLRIRAAKSYSVAELQRQVTNAMSPQPVVSAGMAVAATARGVVPEQSSGPGT